MQKHTHQAQTVRQLPFGYGSLFTCTCGARKREDGAAIAGGVLGADGWYTAEPIDQSREAYDHLQSEGYTEGDEPNDLRDAFANPNAQ